MGTSWSGYQSRFNSSRKKFEMAAIPEDVWSTVGWGMMSVGVSGVMLLVIALLVPIGWSRTHAQVLGTRLQGRRVLAKMRYSAAGRVFQKTLVMPRDVFRNDLVAVEYRISDPSRVRSARISKALIAFYGLPAMWALIFGGICLIR